METITVTLANGRQVAFNVASPNHGQAFFLLGVRKSGSSMINAVCESLAQHNGIHYVDVAGTFFKENVTTNTWNRSPEVNRLLRAGNLYGGFREFPLGFLSSEVFRRSKKVLLVRDPRDALVSEYFSNAFSHSIPTQAEGNDEVTQQMSQMRESALVTPINEYVLDMAIHMNKTLLEYSMILEDDSILVFRYESVILNKRKLIQQICSHFGWKCTDQLVADILLGVDLFPKTEDPKSFVRRVLPGDHVRKLLPDTIARLDQILRPSMCLLGYEH